MNALNEFEEFEEFKKNLKRSQSKSKSINMLNFLSDSSANPFDSSSIGLESSVDESLDKNLLKLNEIDFSLLKKCFLFKNWNEVTFNNFIEDKRVLLKKYKYKDVIAKDDECNNNIFIIKSGDVMVWIKVNRSNIKKHQRLLENYTNPSDKFIYTNVETQKSKHLRDKLLDVKGDKRLQKEKTEINLKTENKNELRNSIDTNFRLDSAAKSRSLVKPVTFNSMSKENYHSNSTKSVLANESLTNTNSIASQKVLKPILTNSDGRARENSCKLKKIKFKDTKLFRASTTNLIRLNRTANQSNKKTRFREDDRKRSNSRSRSRSRSGSRNRDDSKIKNGHSTQRSTSAVPGMKVEQNEDVPKIVIVPANEDQINKQVEITKAALIVEPSISSTEENINIINKENSGVDFLLANNDTTSQISQFSQDNIENENEADANEKNNEYFDSKEILKCNQVRVRNTEMWSEGLNSKFASTPHCFIKMMRLAPGEFFGLSDYLFDEQREKEKIMEVSTAYLSDADEDGPKKKITLEEEYELEKKKPNNYHLITNSKSAECYVIDKEIYLKYMLTFTTDKSLINKYLDDMRDLCPKLPTTHHINQDFVKYLNWNIFKKDVSKDQQHMMESRRSLRNQFNIFHVKNKNEYDEYLSNKRNLTRSSLNLTTQKSASSPTLPPLVYKKRY